jgi:hypothetical protein
MARREQGIHRGGMEESTRVDATTIIKRARIDNASQDRIHKRHGERAGARSKIDDAETGYYL